MQHIAHGTPDSRKWRIVHAAHPCKVCGLTPIAARSAAGWTLRCRQDASHGYHFEQWLKKCVRKWGTQNPKTSR